MIQLLLKHGRVAFGETGRAHAYRTSALLSRVGLLAALAASCGCTRASVAPARDARGTGAAKRPFVPPFAYEAYVRGELALQRGDTHEAATQLELATAAPDEDAYLLSRLAEAQSRDGDPQLAAQTLQEAERVEPCAQSVWLTRASWAERAGDVPAAQRAYEQAVACDQSATAAVLGLARVLERQGHSDRAVLLLSEFGKRTGPEGRAATFAGSLSSRDAGEVCFALESWLDAGALDRTLVEAVRKRALERAEPALLLRVAQATAPSLSKAERAQLLYLTLDREGLRALLAQATEQELGGAAVAASFALFAGDYERAELYAAMASQQGAPDTLHALRASALSALGDAEQAAAQVAAVTTPALQQSAARTQLAPLGLSALGRELQAARKAQ